ncbi:hypothetical protein KKG36_00335 [Patescibacteria group bacterium]|nr:hypothetical protein [Patescibacteria group bacterium]
MWKVLFFGVGFLALGYGLVAGFWLGFESLFGFIPKPFGLSRLWLDLAGVTICGPVFALVIDKIRDDKDEWEKREDHEATSGFISSHPTALLMIGFLTVSFIAGALVSFAVVAVLYAIIAIGLGVGEIRAKKGDDHAG